MALDRDGAVDESEISIRERAAAKYDSDPDF
jgi:hypothetical protein